MRPQTRGDEDQSDYDYDFFYHLTEFLLCKCKKILYLWKENKANMKIFRGTIAIIALVVASCCNLWGAKDEFKTVNERILDSFQFPVPKDADLDKILATWNENGSFDGINYTDDTFNSGHKKNVHILNIGKMARAYFSEKSAYSGSRELYSQITTSMRFWLDLNDQDQNWWWRIIGYPKNLMYPVALLSSELRKNDAALYNDLIAYLEYSWSIPKQRAQLGANGTDICKFMFVAAALEKDEALMKEVMEKVYSLVEIVDGPKTQGIQKDWAFTQHCDTGRQLYLATYGKEYVDGVVYFLQFVNETSWAFPAEKISIIEGLFTEGLAWCWYKGEMDANQCGRKIAEEHSGAPFEKLLKKVIALGTPRKADLGKVLAMMEDRSQITGCRAFPSADYLIQRGEGYCTTIRMTSTRTVCNEAGNGQGLFNYHTGDGACYVKAAGDEYSKVYDHWNWRLIPGTTVAVDNKEMPAPFWGQGGLGGNDFAGVASDGKAGVAAFIFDKDGVQAHKAWFCFEKFMVCLGAGITSSRTDAPVITVVDQKAFEGSPKVGVGVQSCYHAGVGYLFPDGNADVTRVSDGGFHKDIFLAQINHGVAPGAETSYHYAVYPAIDAEEFSFVADDKLEYEVIANTTDVQAVRAGNKVLAVFYKPGSVDLGKKLGTLSVNREAVLVYDVKAGAVAVGNPFCELRPTLFDGLNITATASKKPLYLLAPKSL